MAQEHPVGLVTRTRHGDGAHEINRAVGLMLLLTCSSTLLCVLRLATPTAFSALGRWRRYRSQPHSSNRSKPTRAFSPHLSGPHFGSRQPDGVRVSWKSSQLIPGCLAANRCRSRW